MSKWKFESPSGYDASRFYTKSTDSKGHKETLYLAIPPDIANALSSLVQSRRIPDYRTTQDVVRDAVIHRLQYLRESGIADKQVSGIVSREQATQQAIWHQERLIAYESTMARINDVIKTLCMEPGGQQEASKLATTAYKDLMGITDSPYWRNKYLTQLKEKFGHLIDWEDIGSAE